MSDAAAKIIPRVIDDWGRTLFDPSDAFELLYSGTPISELRFTHADDALRRFNSVCRFFNRADHAGVVAADLETTPEEEHRRRAERWIMPEPFASMDVRAYLIELCTDELQVARVNDEMALFIERGLEPVLRAMVWLIAQFREHGVVWGVGRGSSVASYCLFLIGVHKIDPLRYGFDIREFLR